MARTVPPRSSRPRRSAAPAGDDDVRRLLEEGDVRGAATLTLRRHGAAIRKLLASLLHDEGAAAEAYSRFEENLWMRFATFRGECSVRTWIFRLARNAAADVRRDAWGRKRDPLEVAPRSFEIPVEPEHGLGELRARFADLRRHLTRDDEALLALRIERELSWPEIARILAREGRALDPTTVMKRFARAVEQLRQMARRRGRPR